MALLASDSDEPEIRLKDLNLQLTVILLISALPEKIRTLEHNTKLSSTTCRQPKSSNPQPVL